MKGLKYPTLKKGTLEDGEDIPCSWIRGINIVKMVTLPKADSSFSEATNQIPSTFFIGQKIKNLKIVCKHRSSQIAKAIQSKKNKARCVTFLISSCTPGL